MTSPAESSLPSSLGPWAPSVVTGPNYTPNFGFLSLSEVGVDLDDREKISATRLDVVTREVGFPALATAITHFIAVGRILFLPSSVYVISAGRSGTWRGAGLPRRLQALVDGIGFCGAIRPFINHPLYPGVILGTKSACKAIYAEMEDAELALSIDGEIDFQRYRHLWKYRFDPKYVLSAAEQDRISHVEKMAKCVARWHKGEELLPAFPDVTDSNIVNGKLIDFGGLRLLSRIPTAPQAAANLLPLLDDFSPLDWQIFAHYYAAERGPGGNSVRECIEHADPFGWRPAMDRRDYLQARLLLWNVMKYFQSWRSAPKFVLSSLAICESNCGSDMVAIGIYEYLTQALAEEDEEFGVLHLNFGKALARAGNLAASRQILQEARAFGQQKGQEIVVQETSRFLGELKIFNAGVAEGREVQVGAGEEAVEEAGRYCIRLSPVLTSVVRTRTRLRRDSGKC